MQHTNVAVDTAAIQAKVSEKKGAENWLRAAMPMDCNYYLYTQYPLMIGRLK